MTELTAAARHELIALGASHKTAPIELRERLAVYPQYATRSTFLDPRLAPRVARLIDAEGFVRPDLEVWRHW